MTQFRPSKLNRYVFLFRTPPCTKRTGKESRIPLNFNHDFCLRSVPKFPEEEVSAVIGNWDHLSLKHALRQCLSTDLLLDCGMTFFNSTPVSEDCYSTKKNIKELSSCKGEHYL
jgi:hypothetical protein